MFFKIREAREAADMSQEELANKSGVSRTIISGLENGAIKNTSVKTLVAIAQALDTTVDAIFFAGGG